jgi:putative FmdB family regulatory protein
LGLLRARGNVVAEEATLPLYEYLCPKCGRFELIRKFSDPPLAKCPTCGSKVEKLLAAPAIQFKGTGWYITDYARKSEGGKSGKGGEGSSSSEGKSSDSKPAESASTAKAETASSKPAKGKKSG